MFVRYAKFGQGPASSVGFAGNIRVLAGKQKNSFSDRKRGEIIGKLIRVCEKIKIPDEEAGENPNLIRVYREKNKIHDRRNGKNMKEGSFSHRSFALVCTQFLCNEKTSTVPEVRFIRFAMLSQHSKILAKFPLAQNNAHEDYLTGEYLKKIAKLPTRKRHALLFKNEFSTKKWKRKKTYNFL